MKAKESKLFLILLSIGFVIPSIIYYIQNKTVLNFSDEYMFLLNNSSRVFQTIIYLILLILFLIVYLYIIKKRKEIFDDVKQIYKLVLIISLLFVLIIPFTSSDVFYYLGVGRLTSKYHQNTYYTDIRSYVETNKIDLNKDTVLQKGYINYWGNTTNVYGPVWTIICSGIAAASFGNVDVRIAFNEINKCINSSWKLLFII